MNFRQFHPKVELAGVADGSEAALSALAQDPSIIAGVSRQVDIDDQKKLQAGACKDPMAIIVATDAMALYVHKDNPIATLGVTPEQLQKSFPPALMDNRLRRTGGIGSTGPLASSRSKSMGAKKGADRRPSLPRRFEWTELATPKATVKSNADVCKGIANDLAGVGIGEMSSVQTNIKKVPLKVQGQLISPDEASVLAGRYPLMRPLMLVVDKQQLKSDGGLREAILQYVLSKDGQTEVMKAGFYPLNPSFIRQQIGAISGQQLR